MPLIKASLYAFGLIAAFGGTAAVIGLISGFDPLAILLVIAGYWAIAAYSLGRTFALVACDRDRFRNALILTIVIRILMCFFPCIAVDLGAGAIAMRLVSDENDVFDRGSRDFSLTLLVGCVQGVAGTMQFGLIFGVIYFLCFPRTERTDLCRACGYDIRASHEFGRCPECGAPTPTRSND